MTTENTRIAIVSNDKCKPKKCKQECKGSCPVVKMGKLCIEVTPASKLSFISEDLCIGCGICVKKCPFQAITIINIPKSLECETIHRYGSNSFKLHRLPMPRPGQVLGLVGSNGTGKSTALQILAGKLKPNLGKYDNINGEWSEIITHFRGSELQNYFTKLVNNSIKAVIKPQYVDLIPRTVKGILHDIIDKKSTRGDTTKNEVMDMLDLNGLKNREISQLSGGELQRFAIAITCVQSADMYMFDEPSSYLDIKQRLMAAQCIRKLCSDDNSKYVICVEHDLSVLDYLSDFVCNLYGKPSAYGVVTAPFSVREGINIFLAGFIPTENLRFRQEELTFKVAENIQIIEERHSTVNYPSMSKTLGDFKLHIVDGGFTESEIIVMLGQNGTGKTTFIKMLAGILKSDNNNVVPLLNVSYKPQMIAPKFDGTVRQLFHNKILSSYNHPQFNTDVMKPLNIVDILDQEVKNLSGGELQRVALILALGKPADIYLIDEPSAYLDSEQRIIAAKVIKRFILHTRKTAFIVEHDFIMATYLADRVIVYTGTPGIDCVANSPQDLQTGMNSFLKSLDVTFRRDPMNHRPRINKLNSVKDKEQKLAGTYFYLDTDNELEFSGAGRSKADKKKIEKRGEQELRNEQKEQIKLSAIKDKQDKLKLIAEKEAHNESDNEC